MKIEAAFPICHVRVSRAGEVRSEVYCVVRVGDGALSLEAVRAKLQGDPPGVGEQVTLQAMLPEGVFSVRGRVTECLAGNYVNMVIRQEGEVERVQRREKFRAVVKLPVRIEPEAAWERPAMELITEDANTQGIRVKGSAPLPVGQAVTVTVRLGDANRDLPCRGHVVRCCEDEGGGYDIGIRFLDLDKADEDRIVRALLHRILDF